MLPKFRTKMIEVEMGKGSFLFLYFNFMMFEVIDPGNFAIFNEPNTLATLALAAVSVASEIISSESRSKYVLYIVKEQRKL